MKEKWYLDLDGVRSGPYQTPEVMNLIQEGEVLPHHRISTELRGEEWFTILDWQLKRQPLGQTEVHTSGPKLQKKTETLDPISLPKKDVPQKTENEIQQPSPEPQKATPKRDPTLEMFDLLQGAKQKREQKNTAQTETLSEETKKQIESASSFWSRTDVRFALIAIIGFLLGQYFSTQMKSSDAQKQIATPTPNSSQKQSEPTPTEQGSQNPNGQTNTESETKIIERKTDKFTVRARVPVDSDTPKPAPDPKDMVDLKNELNELRQLKEELKKGKYQGTDPVEIQPMPEENDPNAILEDADQLEADPGRP